MSKVIQSGSINLPYIEFGKCTHCEKCITVCPLQAIEKISNANCDKCVKYCILERVDCFPYNYHFRYDLCNSCGKCAEICPEEAIQWFQR
ncbi:MAG: 4Fe-4S binding protein [Bacteroidales bacterium]|nr:4Fe-4S binding protein [Bacteroidales bacterium]